MKHALSVSTLLKEALEAPTSMNDYKLVAAQWLAASRLVGGLSSALDAMVEHLNTPYALALDSERERCKENVNTRARQLRTHETGEILRPLVSTRQGVLRIDLTEVNVGDVDIDVLIMTLLALRANPPEVEEGET